MEKNKFVVASFLNELLDLYEFELWIDINSNGEKIFRLNDMQGANWSNIEQEEFSTLADIVDRLDSPHQDYIYRSLEEREDAKEIIPKNDWDLTAKRYLESDKVAKILSEITAKEYRKIMNEKEKFEMKDIIELLDSEEKSIEKSENTISDFDIALPKVINYFKENKIKDLMDYGSDSDGEVYKLSSMYKEIMNKFDMQYYDVSTRDKDKCDGKFITTILFEPESKNEVEFETSAWDGIKAVAKNVETIYKNYKIFYEKATNMEFKNNDEFEYEYD